MKLSEYKNEDALELLADIIDPVTKVMQDPGMAKIARTGKKIQIVKYLLKNHAKSIIEVFARVENVPVEEYNGNIISMTKELLEILNDEEMVDFFTSQEQTKDATSSGPAMEITEAKEK